MKKHSNFCYNFSQNLTQQSQNGAVGSWRDWFYYGMALQGGVTIKLEPPLTSDPTGGWCCPARRSARRRGKAANPSCRCSTPPGPTFCAALSSAGTPPLHHRHHPRRPWQPQAPPLLPVSRPVRSKESPVRNNHTPAAAGRMIS